MRYRVEPDTPITKSGKPMASLGAAQLEADIAQLIGLRHHLAPSCDP
jgi:hypothetical protein